MILLKKDYKKEFEVVIAKIDNQVKKLNGEISKHKEDIANIEKERSVALAELQFDSIQVADEKIEELKKVIAQKERIISELDPKKSIALHRVAEKAIDEINVQRDKYKKECSELQNLINNKVIELLELIQKGKEFNSVLDGVLTEAQPMFAVLPYQSKQKLRREFYDDFNGQRLKLFNDTKHNKLILDLQHFKQFNID